MNEMQCIKQFNYPVKDLAQAKKLYSTLLGTQPYIESPYYVGFRIGDQEIGLDPNAGKLGITGPVPFFQVADIKNTLQTLVDAGARVLQQPKDVGGGLLVAYIQDAEGNSTGLLQPPH